MSQAELRKQITNTIIDALKNGNLPPWRKPWRLDRNAGAHANIVSQKNYRGVNQMLLEIAAHRYGFQSRFWATFNQWRGICGQVMRRPADVPAGKWGTTIVLSKPVTTTERNENGEESDSKFWILRNYTVFNIDQVQGDHLDRFRVGHGTLEATDLQGRFEIADSAIAATNADVRTGGNQAFYNFEGDYVQVPHRSQFALPEWYETVMHEMVHWTENSKRLNWDRKEPGNTYALGELIAELGGCYLATELGLPTADNLTNHAAYLKNWLSDMQNDHRFIFKAASQATRAADLILSFSRKAESVAEDESVLVV